MENIKISYLFSKKIIFENLLAGPLKLGGPSMRPPSLRGPRLQPILAYRIIWPCLGATILQSGQPITFGSKTLTDFEPHYANIE